MVTKIIFFFIFGAVLIFLGILNCVGNLSSIHWYHKRKIAEKDLRIYGKLIGLATILIGATLIISAILELALDTAVHDWLVLIGCALGFALMLYAQFKYNKGIF